MKELSISVVYGGPPREEPLMYNPDKYQVNLEYFHDFLQRRGDRKSVV